MLFYNVLCYTGNMNKKDKLVPLNATIPSSLKEYAEFVVGGEYDSISDYIRTLIKNDKKRKEGNDLEILVDTVAMYLGKISSNSENIIDSREGLKILQEKLSTIAALFETGLTLRKAKIRKQNPKISQKELIKKLSAWSLDSPREEVPGLFEVSEDRKKRLLNG